MLLARGAPPKAEILYSNLSADVVREVERRLIAEHREFPWNCNTADGGEGILRDETYYVYGLKEPWVDGRTFYVGIAVDVPARVRQHIAEAKNSCLTLTKSPNLGLFLATFLNGCPGAACVLEANSGNSVIPRFHDSSTERKKHTWWRGEPIVMRDMTLSCSTAAGWFTSGWKRRNCLRLWLRCNQQAVCLVDPLHRSLSRQRELVNRDD